MLKYESSFDTYINFAASDALIIFGHFAFCDSFLRPAIYNGQKYKVVNKTDFISTK